MSSNPHFDKMGAAGQVERRSTSNIYVTQNVLSVQSEFRRSVQIGLERKDTNNWAIGRVGTGRDATASGQENTGSSVAVYFDQKFEKQIKDSKFHFNPPRARAVKTQLIRKSPCPFIAMFEDPEKRSPSSSMDMVDLSIARVSSLIHRDLSTCCMELRGIGT